MKFIKKQKKIILFFAIVLLILIPLYWPILTEIFQKIIHREESSYGLIIPFVSLYFIWLKRARLLEIKKQFSLIGLIPIVIGIFFYFIEIGNERFYFQSLSFIIIVSGLLILFMGKELFKEVSFPVLLLISLIPLPSNFYLGLANLLREINLRGALWITSLINIPFVREDLLVHFYNTTLSVKISCSGVRYFLSYFIFGIVYVYMFRSGLIDRLLVIGFTIPLSILAGTLRLTVIFLSVHFIGAFMGEYVPHLLVSWAVFIIIGAAVVLFDQYIISHRDLKKTTK